MNNLLKFRPEPFAQDPAPTRTVLERRPVDDGQELESQYRFRGSGRSARSYRSSAGSARSYGRTRRSQPPLATATATRPGSRRRPPLRGPRYGWLPTLPIAPYDWPPPFPEQPPPAPGPEEPVGPYGAATDPDAAAARPGPVALASEHVRWVQGCLNRVMGLRLAVDGLMNVETRSAIRSFQERQGLRIDGLVGPDTEKALSAACRAAPNGPAPEGAGELSGELGTRPAPRRKGTAPGVGKGVSRRSPSAASQLIYHPRHGYGWLVRSRAIGAETELRAGRSWGGYEGSADEHEIFGTDDRILVADTTAIPFRFVCCLHLVFLHPTDPTRVFLLRGSGTLISDRHVLTAGHNVLEDLRQLGFPGTRARAARIVVAPGRNGRDFPFDRSEVANMRVSPQWQAAENAQFDFALLTLQNPLGAVRQSRLGNRPLGFWSHPQLGGGTRIRPLELNVLRNKPVNLSGYPTDKCLDQPPDRPATAAEIQTCFGPGGPTLMTDVGSMQWRSFGNIVDPAPASDPRSITYDLDSVTGHSGGPIWLRWQDFRNLVAVNTGGFPSPIPPFAIVANMGVRITEDVLKQLRDWLKADGTTPTF